MHEYEIFIEDINPCGGEQYSKKTLIEAEAARLLFRGMHKSL